MKSLDFSPMRVIAGEAKGQPLKVPRSVRPVTDLVRGAIFSMLDSLTQGGGRVLDLFAGSGALGIEALSRGAGWADFVEHDPRNCSVIKENLERTGLKERAHVYCSSTKRALTFLEGYDAVFLDPPYSLATLDTLVKEVAVSPCLKPGSVLVVAHSSRRPLGDSYDGVGRLKERRHGDTTVSIYKKEVAS